MGGVSRARNAGLEVAEGEYVTFSDSDDVLEPTALEKMIAAASLHNADVVKTAYVRITPNCTEYPIKIDTPYITNDRSSFFAYCERHHYYGFLWNTMLRASIAKAVCFDESLQWLEDNIYTYQCFTKASKFVAIPDVTYHYMVRDVVSLSSVRDPRLILRVSQKEFFVKQSLLNGYEIDMFHHVWHTFHGRELMALDNLYSGGYNITSRRLFYNDYVRIDEDNPIWAIRLFFNTGYTFLFKDTVLRLYFTIKRLLKTIRNSKLT